jgi:hypothetical protein
MTHSDDSQDKPVQWHHFLTGADDPTLYNVSFLSRPAEWHAIGLGALVGATGHQAAIVAFILYLLGRETKYLGLADTLHARDALREPAYAALGLALGLILHIVVFGMPAGWLGADLFEQPDVTSTVVPSPTDTHPGNGRGPP